LFWLTGILAGCSTKKNTPASRAYHNLSSHYNVYFNAMESMKAGLQRIDKSIPEDYTRTLPIFKSTLPEAAKIATSEMEVAIAKCNKLITVHSISKSPRRKTNNSERYKKFASKGEYNKWIDDSYILMGKASFYQHDFHRAIENFNYVIRVFPSETTRYDAFLWMAKCYIETGEYPQALEIFNSLSRDAGFPKRLIQELNLAQAHYYLKDNQPDLAITNLKAALETSLPRADKIRLNYILAQLYAMTDKPGEASKQYTRVIKMRPNYQMAFNARISRMEIAGGDSTETSRQLQKMLDDVINAEYRDRIYYTKGEIALKEGRKQNAIEDFKKSVQYSTTNTKQHALSSLSLARLYFEDNNYLQSACYYDSAVAVIDSDYPGYAEIITRASGLKRLADDLNTVTREDSLQKLALLTDQQRIALINNIIADFQKKEESKALAENSEITDQNYFRSQQYRPQIGGNNNQNLWYFYNPPTVGIGKTEFQRIWGKRKLEDNWRRKNKQSFVESDIEKLAESVKDSTKIKKKVTDPKSVEYYLQDIPLTDSLMEVSNEVIKVAMFDAGRIYKTDFNDFPRSIQTLEELNRRFRGSIYELPVFFELYQLYKQSGDLQKTAEYREKIISGYPESKYARYLLDPNYFTVMEEQKANIEKKYGEALRLFQAYDYAKAKDVALATLAMKPDSSLLSKVKFIEVVASGSGQEKNAFADSLDRYVKSFSPAETAVLALQIKDLIRTNSLSDYQQLVAKGYITDEIVNEETKKEIDHSKDEFGGKYLYDENMFHYYVIAFSKEAKVDISRLIYDIANYNLDYYTSTDFDIEPINLDSKTQLIVVRSIPNKEESLIYFRSIIRKRAVFQALKGVEYVNFVASSSNYRTIIAEKDYLDYLPFFLKNYSSFIGSNIPADELPNPQELLAKVRKEEETKEKGKFVLLQPVTKDSTVQVKPAVKAEYKGPYSQKQSAAYCYTLIFLKKQNDEAKLIKAFESFNQNNYGSPSIKVTVEPLDDNRSILIVSGLGEKTSALAYLQKTVSDQSLKTLFEGSNFRNFIITSENLVIFKKEKNLIQYMDFFNQSK
ncbi:MAG TPA: tetratricopeptide repeat protein, partial [Prolixibacteraceae bacterium]